MVKFFLFAAIIIGVMVFPLFSDVKGVQEQKVVAKELPEVVLKKSDFYMYDSRLVKKGMFDELNIYKKGYIAYNLFVSDLEKNETYKAKKTVFKNKLITGYQVWYKNKDLELNTTQAQYDKETGVLDGGEFELYSKDFRGYGKNFEVDRNKNLFAQNITYFLKVDK